MTDKLTEIRERHEKVYTTAKREGYYHDIDPEDAHDDRGYLLDRITELEADVVCLQERDDKYTNTITGLQTENTRLREQVDSYAHQLHTLQDACKGG